MGGSHTNRIETDDIPDLEEHSSSDSSDDSDYEDDSDENEDENNDEYNEDEHESETEINEHESKAEITGVDTENDIDDGSNPGVGDGDDNSEIDNNVQGDNSDTGEDMDSRYGPCNSDHNLHPCKEQSYDYHYGFQYLCNEYRSQVELLFLTEQMSL